MIATLKLRLVALWLLWRDPRTPRAARWLCVAVLAYALSPIDLIPDFIPVLGLLDDALLLPLGVALVVALVPRPLWQECLERAAAHGPLPRWRWAAGLVVLVWVLSAVAIAAGVWAWWR